MGELLITVAGTLLFVGGALLVAGFSMKEEACLEIGKMLCFASAAFSIASILASAL